MFNLPPTTKIIKTAAVLAVFLLVFPDAWYAIKWLTLAIILYYCTAWFLLGVLLFIGYRGEKR